jgi:hypothetical protein
MAPRPQSFPSAGRRLAAALISHQLGFTGVDRAIKQYRDKKIDPWWEQKAEQLIREMLKRKLFIPPPPKTPRM